MKRIMMLTTGGTIASSSSDHGLIPRVMGEQLLQHIPELGKICRVECREILRMDSSNMQPQDWIHIAKETFKALQEYDGVVITHGTDTMAYTAAALTCFIQNLNKPVILTGSQIPMEQEGTDATGNLTDAFRVAISGRAGVYVVFGGQIIHGSFAKKMYTQHLQAFESINSQVAGTVQNGNVMWSENGDIDAGKGDMVFDAGIDQRVIVIKLTPGIDPSFLINTMKMGYRGVILEAFGCGGIPDQGRSLLPALEYARKHQILVAVTSQCPYDGVDLGVYDVGISAKELGALSGGRMTLEALYVQMMWVLGHTQNYEEAKRIMAKK
ncbi:MAG: asparaginase [Lachnospiraceae bacterium]